jgi:hypothetical protein
MCLHCAYTEFQGTVHYLWEGGGWVRNWGDLEFFCKKKGGSSVLLNNNLGDLKVFVALKIIYEKKKLLPFLSNIY